jgi:hypothetical protein
MPRNPDSYVETIFGPSKDSSANALDGLTSYTSYLDTLRKHPPGENDDSPAYFTERTLSAAGWTPEAVDWAIRNVPTDFRANLRQQGANGIYYPGDPGQVFVDANYRNARRVAQTTEHEMMHAWEHSTNPGGIAARGNPQQRVEDFNRALRELGWGPFAPVNAARYRAASDARSLGALLPEQLSTFSSVLDSLASQLDPTWKGSGFPTAAEWGDPSHVTQMLFNMGYTPEQLPGWFREKYMTEYAKT